MKIKEVAIAFSGIVIYLKILKEIIWNRTKKNILNLLNFGKKECRL
jgi:hypothetical protein